MKARDVSALLDRAFAQGHIRLVLRAIRSLESSARQAEIRKRSLLREALLALTNEPNRTGESIIVDTERLVKKLQWFGSAFYVRVDENPALASAVNSTACAIPLDKSELGLYVPAWVVAAIEQGLDLAEVLADPVMQDCLTVEQLLRGEA